MFTEPPEEFPGWSGVNVFARHNGVEQLGGKEIELGCLLIRIREGGTVQVRIGVAIAQPLMTTYLPSVTETPVTLGQGHRGVTESIGEKVINPDRVTYTGRPLPVLHQTCPRILQHLCFEDELL